MVFSMNFRKALFLTTTLILTLGASAAMAQDCAGSNQSMGPLAAAIAIGVAAFGGALGQGKPAATALEGIARNPRAADKVVTPMIIGLALIESLVIYALVIAFIVSGK